MPHVIINSQLLPAEQALIPIQDRGFRYGDGVFETLRIHRGVPYAFAWHMQRLQSGLAALKIDCQLDAIQPDCRRLIAANAAQSGLLRLQITRGSGSRGYLPDAQSNPTIVIETIPLPAAPPASINLWRSSLTRLSSRALPVRYKLCQGLNSTLARMEAAEHNCFDALLLNEQGELCETSSGNLFWLKNDRLFTPSLACGPLEGATRAAILRLAPYPIEETRAHSLADAQAVIITNAAWGARSVSALLPDGTCWESTALAQRINDALDHDRDQDAQLHYTQWSPHLSS